MSYYDDLGVASSASAEQIQQAFRREAKKLHPDRNPGQEKLAEERFRNLQEIYETLIDPELRADYDELLQKRASRQTTPGERSSSSTSMAKNPSPRGQSAQPPQTGDEGPGRRRLWKHPLFLPIVCGALLLTAAVITVANRPPSDEQLKAVQAEKDRVEEERLAADESRRERELQAAKRKEQSAVIASQLHTIEEIGQEAQSLVQELGEEVDAWEKNVLSLLTSNKGKYIAVNEDNIRAFDAIIKERVPTKRDVDAARRRVKTLLQPIEAELTKREPAVPPSVEIKEALEKESASLELLIEKVRGPKQQVDRLVAIAEQVNKASLVTLKQATINLYAKEQEKQLSNKAAAAKKAAEDIAKAEAQQMEQERVDALRVINAKAEAGKKKADSDVAKQDLVRRAKSAETKALLSFFLTPGHLQADLSETAEKRPFSLAKLEGRNCLDQSPEGQTRLLHCLCTGYEKERPTWKTTPYLSDLTEPKRKKLEEMQKALIELGPTLVELNMLDP